jgi:hypothetical protein
MILLLLLLLLACRWFFQQLILAVDYCHRKGVANRDIKLENTLLQVRGATQRSQQRQTRQGVPLVAQRCACIQEGSTGPAECSRADSAAGVGEPSFGVA